jgi:cytosine deaminase
MTGRILDAGSMSKTDRHFLHQAFEQAKLGYDEGGCPIGSVLALGDQLIASGRNRRVQQGDPIAHGEMDCLRNAGRQKSYRGMTLYTTLSPCMMCAGTIVQFSIPRLVAGEAENFAGSLDFLADRGVEVILADDRECIGLMRRFINENPDLWAEDIAEET